MRHDTPLVRARARLLPGVPLRELYAAGAWLRPELTPPGLPAPVRTLRRWARAGCPPTDVSQLAYLGDAGLGGLVRGVIRGLPPPVQWHVVRAVLVLGVGEDTWGWCHDGPPPRRRQVVVVQALTPEYEYASLIAHECAHAWLRERWTTGDLEQLRRVEARACRLAAAWGFTGHAANPTMSPMLAVEQHRRRLEFLERLAAAPRWDACR